MTATHLFRGNERGEILDADGKVVGRIVPVEPTEDAIVALMPKEWIGHPEAPQDSRDRWRQAHIRAAFKNYAAMLSAAPTDWTTVAVRVPDFRDTSPIRHEKREVYKAEGFNEALDAIMGAKK